MGKTTTEMKFEVSNGRIKNVQLKPDGSCTLIVEIEFKKGENVEINEYKKPKKLRTFKDFILIEASKITPEEKLYKKLVKHEPFKSILCSPVENGTLKDFYIAGMDGSLDENGKLQFAKGEQVAVKLSYNESEKKALEFDPEHNSRLGTITEYFAFLYILIDELIKSGWTFRKAYKAVVKDSVKLGHYFNSKGAKKEFENTGLRNICGFMDLGNTQKILAKDERYKFFYIAGGSYFSSSYYDTLANYYTCVDYMKQQLFATPWIVCTKNDH